MVHLYGPITEKNIASEEIHSAVEAAFVKCVELAKFLNVPDEQVHQNALAFMMKVAAHVIVKDHGLAPEAVLSGLSQGCGSVVAVLINPEHFDAALARLSLIALQVAQVEEESSANGIAYTNLQ